MPNWGGEGVSGEGYFILLHFDNAKRFYSEAQPEGKDFDETGNLLFRLGTDAITAKWLDVEDEAGARVRYDLSGIGAAATAHIMAAAKKATVKKAAAKKATKKGA